MAKQQTFADKLKKHSKTVTCPACGEAIVPTLMLQPITGKSGAVRMREVRLGVCNCNRKEVYG